MESLNEDIGNPRFFYFKKRPYDAVNPRLTFQFWPAFQSELRRKGLSNVLDLQFNPFPTEPSAALRRIKHDDQLAKTRLLKYETDYDDYLLAGGTEPSLDYFGSHRKSNEWQQNTIVKRFASSRISWRSTQLQRTRL